MRRAFFRADVVQVAQGLIGAVLVHHTSEGVCRGRIVETEAYRGPDDQAAHSANGRRTARTEAMWGDPGTVYMFLLYGLHWAFNVVTGGCEQPHAVLVRSIEPLPPMDLFAKRRKMDASRRELTNGPGKLCAAFGLDKAYYGHDLCAGDRLYLEAGDGGPVGRSRRINIDYAGDWVERPWRFYERDNRFVSVKPRS